MIVYQRCQNLKNDLGLETSGDEFVSVLVSVSKLLVSVSCFWSRSRDRPRRIEIRRAPLQEMQAVSKHEFVELCVHPYVSVLIGLLQAVSQVYCVWSRSRS